MKRSIEMLKKFIAEEFDSCTNEMIVHAGSVDDCVERAEALLDVVLDLLDSFERGDFDVYEEAGDEKRG